MFRRIAILIPLFSLFAAFSVSAQNFYKDKFIKEKVVSFGVGPSFAYIDNGGYYRELDFEVRPSFSASFAQRLSPMFDIKATMGIQSITSGGTTTNEAINFWTANNSSFTAKGSALYLDLMPSLNLIPFGNQMTRNVVSPYIGAGLGFLYASTKQTKSFSTSEMPEKVNKATAYIPVRLGVNFKMGLQSDLGAEITSMFSFSDHLDGNAGYNKHNDSFFQLQIVYRRYLFSGIE